MATFDLVATVRLRVQDAETPEEAEMFGRDVIQDGLGDDAEIISTLVKEPEAEDDGDPDAERKNQIGILDKALEDEDAAPEALPTRE